MRERLDVLLARVIEETITEEELVELEGVLDGDVEAQRRYMHTLGVHRDLRELGMLGGLEVEVPKKRWLGRAMLAVAAVFLVGFVALMDWGEGDGSGVDGIARISELSGAVSWTGVGGESIDGLAVGAEIGGGTLEVHAADSWAEFEFRDGTRVVVSGRSALAISDGEDGKLVRLWRGDLSVDAVAQPEGKPMRVITPSAEAEVLGTQFNVSADSQSTRLVVNHGLVQVKRLADGRVESVAEDQVVVAALERESEFRAVPRREASEVWVSDLPEGIGYGEWKDGRLRAKAMLWTKDRETPLLLHTAVVSPALGGAAPVVLGEGTRFRVRGSVERSQRVLFGMTTHHASGGFAGKFETSREVVVGDDGDGRFEFEMRLGEFGRLKDVFPESAVGLEIFDFWSQTLREDVGLEIESVEVFKEE